MAPEPVVVPHPRGSASDHSSRLPGLDGLRACAIAMVIFSHGKNQLSATPLPPFLDRVVFGLWGNLGVYFFFGLSGYLITYLLLREYSATGGISLEKFYLRRAFRILPPLFLFLATVVGLNLAGIVQIPWHSIILSSLFLQNYNFFHYVPYSDDHYIGHLWTLAGEEQFYLLWPFALAWLGPKRMRKVALFLALAAPAIRVGHYFLVPEDWVRSKLTVMFHTTYDMFLWGCLLALCSGDWRVESVLKRFRSVGWFGLVVLVYLVVEPMLELHGGGTYSLSVGLTVRGLCVAFIIAWLGRNTGSWPAKFLNAAPLRAIGIISYSLYLWQQLFMGKAQHTFSNHFIVCVAASLVMACGSYFLLEKPFLKLRRRLGAVTPARPAAQTAARTPVPVPEPTG
jgi:peptidoglycan/LPS O-acetylase OafA/YrhL